MTDHLPTTIQSDPLALIAQAIQAGHTIPVDTLERLLAMRRELKAESAREAYFGALTDFQARCPEHCAQRQDEALPLRQPRTDRLHHPGR